MNKDFHQLYRQLVNEEIDTSQFLVELKSLEDFQNDLLEAMNATANKTGEIWVG